MPKTDEFDFSDSDSASRPPPSYLSRNAQNQNNCSVADIGGENSSSSDPTNANEIRNTISSTNNNNNNNNNCSNSNNNNANSNNSNNTNNNTNNNNINSNNNNNNNNNSNSNNGSSNINNNILLGGNQNSNCSITSGGTAITTGGGGGSNNATKKYRHQNYSKNIYIGTKNAERWDITRARLQFKNDVEFVAYLLKLAENDTERISSLPALTSKPFGNIKLEPNLSAKEFDNNDYIPSPPPATNKKSHKRVQFSESLNGFMKQGNKKFSEFSLKAASKHDSQDKLSDNDDNIPEILDCRIAEKIKNELEQKSVSEFGGDNENFRGALCLKKPKEFQMFNQSDDEDDEDLENIDGNRNSQFRIRDRSEHNQKKKQKKAPFNGKIKNVVERSETSVENKFDEFDEEEEEDEDVDGDGEDNDDDNDVEEGEYEELNDDLKFNNIQDPQSCRECTISHEYDQCPLRLAKEFILDAMDVEEWTLKKIEIERLKEIKNEKDEENSKRVDDDEDSQNSSSSDSKKASNFDNSEKIIKDIPPFCEASVPEELELKKLEASEESGVFTKINIPKYTKLGPLIGKLVQNNDIPDDCNMKNIYEIHNGTKSEFITTENNNLSNWMRFIRPAPKYDECNLSLISFERKAYFVTCTDIERGCELLYWSDDCNSSWRKKYAEKTSCGGCNVKFDHPIHYRTHCSIFHDPLFSLTIRKYHCKICGEAILGKENIIKHAAQMHDGKGAYQCQFCKKFFLRLNYLEMHRTYGCSANPQRTRPLCDFCGKKFCQPQKLKVHIKRMHGDMADLRDFQCKLCSKLLGSRAALQRHNKEVHSRNSAVVSCPRCQKLFQNRSNLKIHMLTHSGVRPFKCAENECTAAFTTKQCLQFHYKKVHNYTPEQMPKIERSVAYTFDAYSGGMKADFLEQAPRRRRKSIEDQHSILSSSMLDSNNDSDFSEENTYDSIKKPSKSIKELCRNETNLSLLSSKITSMFGGNSSNAEVKEAPPKKRKRKYRKNNNQTENITPHIQQQQQQLLQQHQQQLHTLASAGSNLLDDDDMAESDEDRMEQTRRKQNVQLSLVETFLSTTAQRLNTAVAAAVNSSVNNIDDPKMSSIMHETELPDDSDNNFRHGSTNSRDSSINSACQNLVVSKGSKKWISDDDPRHHLQQQHLRGISSNNFMGNNDHNDADDDDPTNKILPNRDLIARFMNMSNNNEQTHLSSHHHHQMTHEDDENSSFLDVVDSNNQGGHQIPQQQQQQQQQFHDNDDNQSQLHMNPISHTQSFMSSFYGNSNARLGGAVGGGGPTNASSTSASMLVEAALNSVGNIMDGDSNGIKCSNNSGLDPENDITAQINVDNSRFGNNNGGSNGGGGSSTDNDMNNIESLENEIKMMKSLNQFPMQIPPLPMFQQQNSNAQQNSTNLSSCNISPNNSTPTNNQTGNNNNDIDVDPNSTPRTQQMGDSDRFSNHHQTPPTPQPISPGRDYSMFAGGNSGNAPGGNVNNISVSSPISSLQNRRSTASSGVYPEHELISPASSPAIPRYDFSSEICRKREQIENERAHNMSAQNQLSSDEENSLIAQNNTPSGEEMRMKFPQSQMDLMYSKYESMANSSLKYNNNQDLEVQDFRNNSSNDLSDLQGLDMTSRSNQIGSNYHNFQLPSSSNSNIGGTGSGGGLSRYHHHIYDILSEREQQQHQQQQQQQQHQQQEQLAAMQQHQSMHNMLPEQLNDPDHDQTTSVDLSRTANYVVSPPPSIPPYAHPHHDMLRMVSLDLTPNTNMGNQRSFLSSQMQHNSRETLDHHRLLSTAEQHRILAASNPEQHRLLVDPTAHLLMEQNNRLLSSDQSRLLGETAQGRHMSRGFGAYHQVASSNYHPSVRPVLPSANHHTANPTNYHPFPAYY